MKTYQPKESEIKREWRLVDAKDKVLGRIATEIALMLMGKNKPDFSTHMDTGDFVVVLNSEKIVLTGKKAQTKSYKSHSGYPGGFKERKFAKVMEEHPERVLQHAVEGMLPDNKLKTERMKRLNVVIGEKNPFESKFLQKGDASK